MSLGEFSFPSADGRLRLYGRDQGPRDAPLTVLCLGGAMSNVMEFEDLAKHLSAYRVISVDQRGRGRSEWDPDPANYSIPVQAADMIALLDRLAIEHVVLIGTSNGGYMSIAMGVMAVGRIVGMILNDAGPEMPTDGLRRMRAALSNMSPVKNWVEAAAQAKSIEGISYPSYSDADWSAHARRAYLEDGSGRPVAAYDPAVLDAVNAADLVNPLPDMWHIWAMLDGIPILVVRGATSDILPQALFDEMLARHPRAQGVVVPGRGHFPRLDEPAASTAIDRFLIDLETRRLI